MIQKWPRHTPCYGEKDDECLVWDIIDGTFLVDGNDPLQYTEEVCFKAEITEEEVEDPAEVFLTICFHQ